MIATSENAPIAACDNCRLSTVVPQLLTPVRRSFRNGIRTRRLLCPRCAARNTAHSNVVAFVISNLIVYLILFAIFGSAFGDQHDDWTSLLAFGLSLFLATPILVFFHELAHATVGWAVGMGVFGITVGWGPRLYRWRVGSWFLDINAPPLGGSCCVAPKSDRTSAWKMSAMLGAGIMFHFLVLMLIIYVATSGLSVPLQRPFLGWWAGVFFINFFMLIGSLMPRNVRHDGRETTNDGKRILILMHSKFSQPWTVGNSYRFEIEACLESGRVEDARHWLEQARSVAENSLTFRVLELSILGIEGNWKCVAAKAKERLGAITASQEREAVAAWAAVAIVYNNGDIAEAHAFCNESMSVCPWEPSLQTVRALVYLAQGRLDDAESCLKQAHVLRLSWAAQIGGSHIWAELYRRKGDVANHRKWDRRARAMDPRDAFGVSRIGNA